MGTSKPDECIFCEEELEKWEYEYYVENGMRAGKEGDYDEMDICKNCIKKLKVLLEGSDLHNKKKVSGK